MMVMLLKVDKQLVRGMACLWFANQPDWIRKTLEASKHMGHSGI